jgi:hypothetical protein
MRDEALAITGDLHEDAPGPPTTLGAGDNQQNGRRRMVHGVIGWSQRWPLMPEPFGAQRIVGGYGESWPRMRA